jgi:hypothetical protein
MPARISAVVLKADYQKVFRYEIILCAILLVFALDVNELTKQGKRPPQESSDIH